MEMYIYFQLSYRISFIYSSFQTVDDEKGNTNMDELIEAQISSKDELMDLMNEGEKQRHGKHLRLFPNLGIF